MFSFDNTKQFPTRAIFEDVVKFILSLEGAMNLHNERVLTSHLHKLTQKKIPKFVSTQMHDLYECPSAVCSFLLFSLRKVCHLFFDELEALLSSFHTPTNPACKTSLSTSFLYTFMLFVGI